MAVRERAHYVVRADDLADWIARQPDAWWSVIGEPELKGLVDFPCPSDELVPEIRRMGKNLRVLDHVPPAGEDAVVKGHDLDEMTVDYGRHQEKALYLSWRIRIATGC